MLKWKAALGTEEPGSPLEENVSVKPHLLFEPQTLESGWLIAQRMNKNNILSYITTALQANSSVSACVKHIISFPMLSIIILSIAFIYLNKINKYS